MLYGACDSVVRRPYGPFVEAIEQLVRSIDDGVAARRLSARRAGSWRGCCRTWPSGSASCRHRSRPIPTPSATVSTARSATCSPRSGRRAPLVVVIEDGHWADTPTLLLLAPPGARRLRGPRAGGHHVPRHRGRGPEALSAALVDLRRSEGVVRLRLGGLSTEEIGEFVAARGGRRPRRRICREVARVLSELTGGNAFLMTELWRTLLETETVSGLRAGVSDLARRTGRAREPRGRAGGREPAARPAEHRHDRSARAGRRRRAGVRPSAVAQSRL